MLSETLASVALVLLASVELVVAVLFARSTDVFSVGVVSKNLSKVAGSVEVELVVVRDWHVSPLNSTKNVAHIIVRNKYTREIKR